MMPFLKFSARSQTKKERREAKPGKTISEKKQSKKKKLLQKLFPLLKYRCRTNQSKTIHQHYRSK